MGAEAQAMMDRTLVFTYGTLKRGFSNHGLIQEMIHSGDAAFVGVARTAGRLPLVCGPYRVPFLLNLPGAGERVRGELYAVSPRGIARMDDLEGTCRGHYERLPISVVLPRRRHRSVGTDGEGDGEEEENGDDEVEVEVEAEAYYAHRSYAAELWRRIGERGFEAYSEKEARGYVKRKDRPQDTTFLDHIRIFVSFPPQN
ncbi:putative gamma-glutamylcyclotransferase At3g02910 [Elaeis guineensis]|uniref:putative gamma-glutamylcyclotransferase At3g02910 n=1 Tax=Elaeis guineensis var. tenera TaxID=51953 RepID=UPI003C6D0BF7